LPGRRGADMTPRRFAWHWRGHFPKGKVIEACGDPGVYKTGVVIDLCARITVGAPFPTEPDDWRHEPARVLFFSAEDDDSDTLLPRLLRREATRNRFALSRRLTRYPICPRTTPNCASGSN
jgi:hypothetical protein